MSTSSSDSDISSKDSSNFHPSTQGDFSSIKDRNQTIDFFEKELFVIGSIIEKDLTVTKQNNATHNEEHLITNSQFDVCYNQQKMEDNDVPSSKTHELKNCARNFNYNE